MVVLWHTCEDQSSYLSQISQIIFVEKKLSCEEILGNFEKFWEILPQFMRFKVEKNWAKKVICGEKMTNMRSAWNSSGSIVTPCQAGQSNPLPLRYSHLCIRVRAGNIVRPHHNCIKVGRKRNLRGWLHFNLGSSLHWHLKDNPQKKIWAVSVFHVLRFGKWSMFIAKFFVWVKISATAYFFGRVTEWHIKFWSHKDGEALQKRPGLREG